MLSRRAKALAGMCPLTASGTSNDNKVVFLTADSDSEKRVQLMSQLAETVKQLDDQALEQAVSCLSGLGESKSIP